MPVTPALDYATTGDIQIYIENLATTNSLSVAPALNAIITRVSRRIDTYCNRRFYTSTGDEVRTFDGPRFNRDPWWPTPGLAFWFGTQRFMPDLDFVSVTTLQIANGTNDAANSLYTTIDSRDYYLEPTDKKDQFPYQWLEMSDSPIGTYSTAPFMWFSPGKSTIKITGKFGWNSTSVTQVPDDIRECAIEMVVRTWRSRDIGFANQVGVDSLGSMPMSNAMPNSVREVLDTYRKIQIT